MDDRIAALSQAVAISGLGGIGKTQTAIEYAYRYFYDTPTYDWVFWFRADTELNLVTDLAEIGRSLHLWGDTIDELAKQTRRWLETHDGWLLIFDNADQPKLVAPWLPRNPQGRVLLTSRSQGFVKLGIKDPIKLPKLSQDESIAFLQQRCDRPSLKPIEQAAVSTLAQELDGLPLALEQAAAYVQRTGISFAVYWQHYQRLSLDLLERQKPETGDYPASVETTWLLNFEEIEKRSPASIPILQLSSVLAGDNIPEELLLVYAENFGLINCTDELALAEQLAALADFSLIQRERETASYSIHRMVQAVVWQRLTAAEQQNWIQRVISVLNAVFSEVEKAKSWALCEMLVPHIQTIATRSEAIVIDTYDWALLLNQAGYYLKQQGRYKEAEPLLVRSLYLYEQQLGVDHLDTALALNNLGLLFESQGRYDEAKPLLVRSLQICEQQLGAYDPKIAVSLNNLAGLYQAQSHYEEAEPIYARALQICEQQSGADHLDTAASLNNLGELYRAQGQYEKAEPLHVRAIGICRQRLGMDHPHTATSLNNLALLYESQNRYVEAEDLYMQALVILMNILGATHPRTTTVGSNLISLLIQKQLQQDN